MSAYENNNKILPSCRYIKAKNMGNNLSSYIFCWLVQTCIPMLQIKIFVQMVHWYIELYRWRSWYISNMKNKYFFLSTLDGSTSICIPKLSMNLLHSVLFYIKMESEFSIFSATSLTVIQINPALIESRHKICDMLHLLFPIILYHTSCPCRELGNFLKCNSNFVTPRIWWKTFLLRSPVIMAYSIV